MKPLRFAAMSRTAAEFCKLRDNGTKASSFGFGVGGGRMQPLLKTRILAALSHTDDFCVGSARRACPSTIKTKFVVQWKVTYYQISASEMSKNFSAGYKYLLSRRLSRYASLIRNYI